MTQCISEYKATLPIGHGSRISQYLWTIPHTGTQYTLRLLRNRMGCGTRHSHISWPRDIAWVDEMGNGAICTTRDPRKVAISMLGRGEKLNPRLWEVIARWALLERVYMFHLPTDEAGRQALADHVGYLGPLEPWSDKHDNSKGDPLGLKALYAGGGTDERVEAYADAVKNIYWRSEWSY